MEGGFEAGGKSGLKKRSLRNLGVPPQSGVGLRWVSLRSSRLRRDRCAALCPPHAGMYAKRIGQGAQVRAAVAESSVIVVLSMNTKGPAGHQAPQGYVNAALPAKALGADRPDPSCN
jgi:hypothetical protein